MTQAGLQGKHRFNDGDRSTVFGESDEEIIREKGIKSGVWIKIPGVWDSPKRVVRVTGDKVYVRIDRKMMPVNIRSAEVVKELEDKHF